MERNFALDIIKENGVYVGVVTGTNITVYGGTIDEVKLRAKYEIEVYYSAKIVKEMKIDIKDNKYPGSKYLVKTNIERFLETEWSIVPRTYFRRNKGIKALRYIHMDIDKPANDSNIVQLGYRFGELCNATRPDILGNALFMYNSSSKNCTSIEDIVTLLHYLETEDENYCFYYIFFRDGKVVGSCLLTYFEDTRTIVIDNIVVFKESDRNRVIDGCIYNIPKIIKNKGLELSNIALATNDSEIISYMSSRYDLDKIINYDKPIRVYDSKYIEYSDSKFVVFSYGNSCISDGDCVKIKEAVTSNYRKWLKEFGLTRDNCELRRGGFFYNV